MSDADEVSESENIISSEEDNDPKPQTLDPAQRSRSSTNSIVSSFLERPIKQDVINIDDDEGTFNSVGSIRESGTAMPNGNPDVVVIVDTLKKSLGIPEGKSFILLSEEYKAQVSIRLENILDLVSDGATDELMRITRNRKGTNGLHSVKKEITPSDSVSSLPTQKEEKPVADTESVEDDFDIDAIIAMESDVDEG